MRPFGAVSRWAGFLLGLALVLALGLTPVKAQTGGTVSGVVTDSTGAVVVGANVSLIDSKTHSARNTTTNGAGRYVFTNVDPGPYDFTFSQTGFAVTKVRETVSVGMVTTVNVALKVGTTTQEVLVEACGADGVHVGQSDTPLEEARSLVGAERIVGLSATTAEELLSGDPDYWGVGAIFGTPTKPDSSPGGLDLVRAAATRLTVPWFAIGGVELSNVAELAAAGAPGVAVVRAIRDAADPEAAARLLRNALDRKQ